MGLERRHNCYNGARNRHIGGQFNLRQPTSPAYLLLYSHQSKKLIVSHSYDYCYGVWTHIQESAVSFQPWHCIPYKKIHPRSHTQGNCGDKISLRKRRFSTWKRKAHMERVYKRRSSNVSRLCGKELSLQSALDFYAARDALFPAGNALKDSGSETWENAWYRCMCCLNTYI